MPAINIKLPTGAEEKVIATRENHQLIVGYYPYGNPKNRITIRAVGNVDPTKDIVFEAIVRDNKVILQYPLYFKLDRMCQMLQFIKDNDKSVIEAAKEMWRN